MYKLKEPIAFRTVVRAVSLFEEELKVLFGFANLNDTKKIDKELQVSVPHLLMNLAKKEDVLMDILKLTVECTEDEDVEEIPFDEAVVIIKSFLTKSWASIQALLKS